MRFYASSGVAVTSSFNRPCGGLDTHGIGLRLAGLMTALFIFPASLLGPWAAGSPTASARIAYVAFIVMGIAVRWL